MPPQNYLSVHRRICQGAGGGGSPPVLKKFGQNAENLGKITKFGPKFWWLFSFFWNENLFFDDVFLKIFFGNRASPPKFNRPGTPMSVYTSEFWRICCNCSKMNCQFLLREKKNRRILCSTYEIFSSWSSYNIFFKILRYTSSANSVVMPPFDFLAKLEHQRPLRRKYKHMNHVVAYRRDLLLLNMVQGARSFLSFCFWYICSYCNLYDGLKINKTSESQDRD